VEAILCPHTSSTPSGHLEKVQQFLLRFAQMTGVEAMQDSAGNIVMRKPASPGYGNRKGVILQAHMDMVPQKGPDSNHNFETDPIETRIEGEWVKANNTTLGADDGIGVAAIMAIMEDKTLKHGPLEALITTDEETNMYGANHLPEGELRGDILLNLDTETWGKFVIGSAGGIDISATIEYKEVETDPDDAALKITIKGLKGGHSGLEIHEGRANAIKQMVRIIKEAVEDYECRLATWKGGTLRNAVPSFAEAVITMPKGNIDAVKDLVKEWQEDIADEFKGIEDNVIITAEEVPTPKTEMPEEIQNNVIDAIYACHNGVMRMIPAYPSVVETSSNLAVINIKDGKTQLLILARSAREDMKEYITETLQSCFNMAGMKVETSGGYVGWDPNPDSPALHLLLDTYKELFKREGSIQVDHAGLECSIILDKYPHLDIVSFGPHCGVRTPQ